MPRLRRKPRLLDSKSGIITTRLKGPVSYAASYSLYIYIVLQWPAALLHTAANSYEPCHEKTFAYAKTSNRTADQRFLYPPQTVFVGGYTVFTLSVRPCVRPSVTLCFLNIFKSNGWNFIKPCIHIHIYRAIIII